MRKQSQFWKAGLACSLLAVGIARGAAPARAQTATFPDVPANHWAYQAVADLADKGYVKGYPSGKFLGGRALTRYEFATVIDRMVQTIADLSATVKAGQPVATPTGVPVTQDDLSKIQALVDGFKTQLDAIQSQIGPAQPGGVSLQDEIDALRSDLQDLQANVTKAQSTADNSYGSGSSRKFQISGYVQARYFESGKSKTNYPQGTAAVNGAYNGNYAQGGNNESFEVRRARLKVSGQVTPNTKYAVQIDTSGAITAGTTTNQQVTVREGYVAYTFGKGDPTKAPTITAGEFATPFGYELPASTANILTPERHLVTSEASYGIMANEDYDKGVQISYNTPQQLLGILPGGLRLTAAFINGTGRASEDTDRRIDQVYHIAYQTPNKVLGLGLSYWDGQLGAAGAGANFGRKRQLYGADAQLAFPFGAFLQGEYVDGKFEQRTAFAGPAALVPTTTDAPGNKIEGYYLQGGYTFGQTSAHPLSLFVSYDVLRRAEGSTGSSDSYTDENTGYGASYNLDKQTRFRVYYIKPDKVAHAPGTAGPLKIGQTIGELQVKF